MWLPGRCYILANRKHSTPLHLFARARRAVKRWCAYSWVLGWLTLTIIAGIVIDALLDYCMGHLPQIFIQLNLIRVYFLEKVYHDIGNVLDPFPMFVHVK